MTDTQHTEIGDDVVAQYYRDTRWHYRGLWSGRNTFALHYGYWSADVNRHADSLAEMNAVLADRAGIGPGTTVLDAGCGVGGSSIWLARNRGAQVTGINIEPGQVYRARENSIAQGTSARTEFLVRSFTDTALPDESCDVVWAIEAMCYAAEKKDFASEAYRVLKPGGRLVVADFFRARRGLGDADERRVRTWFEQWMIPDLTTIDEFEDVAASTGFAEVSTEDATPRVRPSARRLFAIGCATAPIAHGSRLGGLSTELQHANWRSTVLQYTTLRRGLWRYGITLARKPLTAS